MANYCSNEATCINKDIACTNCLHFQRALTDNYKNIANVTSKAVNNLLYKVKSNKIYFRSLKGLTSAICVNCGDSHKLDYLRGLNHNDDDSFCIYRCPKNKITYLFAIRGQLI